MKLIRKTTLFIAGITFIVFDELVKCDRGGFPND